MCTSMSLPQFDDSSSLNSSYTGPTLPPTGGQLFQSLPRPLEERSTRLITSGRRWGRRLSPFRPLSRRLENARECDGWRGAEKGGSIPEGTSGGVDGHGSWGKHQGRLGDTTDLVNCTNRGIGEWHWRKRRKSGNNCRIITQHEYNYFSILPLNEELGKPKRDDSYGQCETYPKLNECYGI